MLRAANKHTSFSSSAAVHHGDLWAVFKGMSENVLSWIYSGQHMQCKLWIHNRAQIDFADILFLDGKVLQKRFKRQIEQKA